MLKRNWELMHAKSNDRGIYLRRTYQFLFSLNLGLAWVLWRSFGPFFLELRWQYKINRLFHFHPHSNFGGYAASFGLAFIFAVCAFLLVVLIESTFRASTAIAWVVGIGSVAVLPTCWFYGLPMLEPPPIETGQWLWPLLELLAVVFSVVLCLYTKWHIPLWLAGGLLLLHSFLWGWIRFGSALVRNPVYLVFPVVAFFSSLSWVLYLNQTRADRRTLGEQVKSNP